MNISAKKKLLLFIKFKTNNRPTPAVSVVIKIHTTEPKIRKA
jgi:hypothetical protein